MPKYIYKCSECSDSFEVIHSFGESVETCLQINNESKCSPDSTVERVPQFMNLVKKQEKDVQVGQVVSEHIEEAKKEVEEYKEEMKNWTPKQ